MAIFQGSSTDPASHAFGLEKLHEKLLPITITILMEIRLCVQYFSRPVKMKLILSFFFSEASRSPKRHMRYQKRSNGISHVVDCFHNANYRTNNLKWRMAWQKWILKYNCE